MWMHRNASRAAHDPTVAGDVEVPGLHQSAEIVGDRGAGEMAIQHAHMVLDKHTAALWVEVGVVDSDLTERHVDAGLHGRAGSSLVREFMGEAESSQQDEQDPAHSHHQVRDWDVTIENSTTRMVFMKAMIYTRTPNAPGRTRSCCGKMRRTSPSIITSTSFGSSKSMLCT